MKQVSYGSSTPEPVFEKGYPKHEAYYDYMVRKSREEDERLGIDHRSPDQKIRELTDRIKQLEVDMAHVLKEQR